MILLNKDNKLERKQEAMKKIAAILMSIVICLTSAVGYASYLYSETKTEAVAGGIKYEEKNILTKDSWIKAYVAYIDLESPNTAIKVLTAQKGSSYLENVKTMAQKEDVAVAINGDFFNVSSSQTNMLGMVYKEGELISTPALDNQVSFVVTRDNEIIMDYFSFSSTVYSPQGYSCPIYQINKVPASGGAITMLTDKWGDKTWGVGFKELIVENDVVTNILEAGSDAAKMPQNGYVLVTNPEVNGFLDNFAIGDVVTVETFITPEVENIMEATGGNTLLVQDGKVAQFTGNVTGYAQRSSVGISKDKKTLILAATEGRTKKNKGLTQTEMAKLMISLGADKAINLDGGGSTTLVIKNKEGKHTVKNEQTYLRPVSTSIGIVDKGIKGEKAVSGKISADKDAVLLGDTIKFYAEFYDEYGGIFDDSKNIKFYDENGNTVKDGIYTAKDAGQHTIYAALGDAICKAEIFVCDSVKSINIIEDDIKLEKGKSESIKLSAYSADGKRIYVNPALMEWKSDNKNIVVKDGIVSARERERAVISAGYGGKFDYVSINRDVYTKKAPFATANEDLFEGSLKNGVKIAVSGSVPRGTTLFNRYHSLERLKTLEGFDKAFVTDNFYASNQGENTTAASGYSVYNKDGSCFVTISTGEGYVKNASEWANLYTATTGSAKNLVVITQKSPDELSDEENTRIRNMLKTAAENGKNVFYVYSGSKPQLNIENGVRYICAGEVAEYKTTTADEMKKYAAFVVFYVSGNEIKYEFVS